MRVILHVDMNNFYASVECLFHPELSHLPLAVAGDPINRHGIILAKNMIAKNLGVKTGEPLWQAKLKAPKLVTVPPDFKKYLHYSRLAKDILYTYTDQIEPFGIDENWLDVTGSQNLFGSGAEIADKIRRQIKDELGLTVSIGVSFNKIFAKLGSDYKKPDAVTVISKENYKQIVWPLPAGELLYVGRSSLKKLNTKGIFTIGDIATASPEKLTAILGKWGYVLWCFANGKDDSPVRKLSESAAIKSIGNGTTCHRDLTTDTDVRLVFTVLAESISARLLEYGLKCTAVQIQIRDNKLRDISRQKHLTHSTYASRNLIETAMELFSEHYSWQFPVRALSLRAFNLVDAYNNTEISLFEDTDKLLNEDRLTETVYKLRQKYGTASVFRASCLLDSALAGFNPKEDHTIHPTSFFR